MASTTFTPLAAELNAPSHRSHARIAWRRFRRHRMALLGLVILLVFALAATCAPLIAPYGIDEQDLFNTLQPPSAEHMLGTDALGRDVLTRLLYGGRVSLTVGIVAAMISTAIGLAVGAVAGYYGGLVDAALMRLVDLLLAFPTIFLLLILFSIVRASVFTVILWLGAFGWLYLARIVRGELLALRQKEFVEAAQALGLGSGRIIVRHLLPNILAAVIVTTTLEIAGNMLAEATLSFLGYGVPPEVPTWGNMLTSASSYYTTVPLLAIIPGLTLTLAVLAVNFIGDGLRDALDPKGAD